jgi:hypothetical protein
MNAEPSNAGVPAAVAMPGSFVPDPVADGTFGIEQVAAED